MIQLNAHESRILGVLVEKALTTPAQYPLTLNAIVNGCNQKSNRDPVMNMTDDHVFDALDTLRQKGLAREVMMSGSRVEKYRHVAKEVLETDTAGLVLLMELLLRGPQTVGELRSRASRMHPLESTEAVAEALRHLRQRDEPLVRELAPAPGSRAKRYAQLLSPDLHPLDAPAATTATSRAATGASEELESRIDALQEQVTVLRKALSALAVSIGRPDPFAAEQRSECENG
jgi:uncharacterized protein YceH (UPF0502 family)